MEETEMRLALDYPNISREKVIALLADSIGRFANGPGDPRDERREWSQLWWDSWVKPRYEMIARIARGEELDWSDQEHVVMMIHH